MLLLEEVAFDAGDEAGHVEHALEERFGVGGDAGVQRGSLVERVLVVGGG